MKGSLPEVLEALGKNERVVLSHSGRRIALLQPVQSERSEPDVDDEIRRIRNHPAVGMWADRDDMKDPAAWVRGKRQRRRERLFAGVGGDGA